MDGGCEAAELTGPVAVQPADLQQQADLGSDVLCEPGWMLCLLSCAQMCRLPLRLTVSAGYVRFVSDTLLQCVLSVYSCTAHLCFFQYLIQGIFGQKGSEILEQFT